MMELSTISSVFSNLGTIAAAIISIIAVLMTIAKPIRKRIINLFSMSDDKKKLYAKVDEAVDTLQKNTQKGNEHDVLLKSMNEIVKLLQTNTNKNSDAIEILKEQALCNTRDSLTRIWEKTNPKGKISRFQLQNFLDLYDVYIKLGGNSYIHQIHEEIIRLPIVE